MHSRTLGLLLPLLALVGCSDLRSDDDDGGDDDDSPPASCDYPEGSVEPMAMGEVLTPYSWPSSLDGNRDEAPLALSRAFCDDDPLIDWSPFDLLLFVSIPAW
ncbi:MAG: hypothetical protein VX498_15845 [Myxococcota bacterium]|nr:hypothetical protein [Myxococcota bacterium]